MAPHEESLVDEEPPDVNPYKVLGIEKSATETEVKSAYRKAALKHHPDKAPEHLKSSAHTAFQNVAFAYAILSDPARRNRYDATGSTSESITDAEGFSWSNFYDEQYKNAISGDAIEKFAKQYKGSDEEIGDLLAAYVECQGKMEKIYTIVMLSHPAHDEERFRGVIDAAIERGEIKAFKAYVKETEDQRRKRIARFDNEGKEAMEYAQKLGIADQLFNQGKNSTGQVALKALIQKNQKSRGSFLDNLEAKYAPKPKSKTSKKRISEEEHEALEEPSEEAFQAAAARLQTKKDGKVEGSAGRRPKRTKH